MRDFDEFESRLVHAGFELLVTIPVAIGFFRHDAAFEQQALEDRADIELRVIRVTHAQSDVFEIAKKRKILIFNHGSKFSLLAVRQGRRGLHNDFTMREGDRDAICFERIPQRQQNFAADVGQATLRIVDPEAQFEI